MSIAFSAKRPQFLPKKQKYISERLVLNNLTAVEMPPPPVFRTDTLLLSLTVSTSGTELLNAISALILGTPW